MTCCKGIIIFFAGMLISVATLAQHPNFKKVDSLKNILPAKQGAERIDCLNDIGEEYWWPVPAFDSIVAGWAGLAYKESLAIHYTAGEAKSLMLLGVSEILNKNFLAGDKYVRKSLSLYEALQSDYGRGWCNVWIGQALYGQNKFDSAIFFQEKSVFYFEKTNDWEGEGKAWAWTGMTYATLGNYDSSFYYCSKSLVLRKKMSDHACVFHSYMNMGYLYRSAGSYSDAMDYYNKGFDYAKAHHMDHTNFNWTYFELIGTIYKYLNSTDSSYYFLRRSVQGDSTNEMTRVSFGEILLARNQYDSALSIFLKPVDVFRKGNDQWDLMRVLMDASKANLGKGNFKAALSYGLEAFSSARHARTRQFLLDGYLLLSKIYYKSHRYDSAYLYDEKFRALKDSLVNSQFLWNLTNFKERTDFKNKMDQLAVLGNENKIKEEKLKQEARQKWILVIFFFVAAFAGVFLYNNLALKRKNEKLESRGKQTELQHHVTELEMQALRAQMNPHFIFNCLSSINRFILKNETEAASNYLTKFSRLIRTVLTNSKKSFISLEDELEMLRLYLDMEKLRFKDSFDYSITFINSIDDGNVFLPPLLFQPFAENAIWHGLMHKEGQGKLEFELSIDEKVLTCSIADNGVGRNKAAAIRSKSAQKEKSLGLQITKERLALLSKELTDETFFHFDDLFDSEGIPSGTRVTLRVNYKTLTDVISES
jgi:hypothetical protein